MNNRRYRKDDKISGRMFLAYITFLLSLSFGIAIMPMGSAIKTESLFFTIVSGILTWLGLIGTIFVAIKINIYIKAFKTNKNEKPQLGLTHFFQNKEAFFIDIVMFVAICGFVLSKFLLNNIVASFVLLALFVFSFGMHCMLNGENYRYFKIKTGRDREL